MACWLAARNIPRSENGGPVEPEKIHVTFDHHVLLWLLGLPLPGWAIVALLGRQRGEAVRGVSLVPR